MSADWAIRAVRAMREICAILGRYQIFAILVKEGGGLVVAASQGLESGHERWLRALSSPTNKVTCAVLGQTQVLGGAPVGVQAQDVDLYPLRDGEEGPVVGALAFFSVLTVEDGRDEMLKLAAALGSILADALAHQALDDKVAYERVRAGDVSTCEK